MVCILSELGTCTRNLVKNSCKNGLHSEKSKEYISNVQIRKPYFLICFPFAMSSQPLHIDITGPFHCHWHVQMTQITEVRNQDIYWLPRCHLTHTHEHTSDDHYGASPIQLYIYINLADLFCSLITQNRYNKHSNIGFIIKNRSH